MKNIMLLHRQSFKNQMSDQKATDIKIFVFRNLSDLDKDKCMIIL